MAAKHAGLCPYCKTTVTPIVLELNTLRRDKCRCPECGEVLLVCRSPGCDNYAKGGELYDDELCPECTRTVTSSAGAIIVGVVATALTAIVAKESDAGE